MVEGYTRTGEHRRTERIKVKPKGRIVERVKEVLVDEAEERILDVTHTENVPGKVIKVPKSVLVETEVILPRFIDEVVPAVVAQRVEPIIRESTPEEGHFIDVKCRVLTFKPTHVDVCVPLPVQRELIAAGSTQEYRELLPRDVAPEHYNAVVRSMNPEVQMSHLMQLFQVTPEVAAKIEKGEFEEISKVGAIPCMTGPCAAYVEVPEATAIKPAREGGNFPHKVFPGEYKSYPNIEHLQHHDGTGKAPAEAPSNAKGDQETYVPYNYGFEPNKFYNPSRAVPFHVHHHIGEKRDG